MNRRRFLKTTAVVATALPLAGCEFKSRTKSKWIAFKDQMPESTDKFEMKERKTGTIKKGYILELKWNDDSLQCMVGESGRTIRPDSKKQFVMYRLTENSMIVIEIKKWDWRYIA